MNKVDKVIEITRQIIEKENELAILKIALQDAIETKTTKEIAPEQDLKNIFGAAPKPKKRRGRKKKKKVVFHKWTDDDFKQLMKLNAEDKTDKEIAKIMDRNYGSINMMRWRINNNTDLPKRFRKLQRKTPMKVKITSQSEEEQKKERKNQKLPAVIKYL